MPESLSGTSPTLTGARQTMMSWARLIESSDEIPEKYTSQFLALADGAAVFPHTVLAPPQALPGNRRSAERLLCEIGGVFYILQQAGGRVTATGFRYEDITSLEIGNILLYSWFSIHGKTLAGAGADMRIEFNEATLRHFEPYFRNIRPVLSIRQRSGGEAELAKFEFLKNENYKLMNFARQSLVEGDRVISALYQPACRQSLFNLFGRNIYKTISMDQLIVLTGRELMLLGDTESMMQNKRSKYGGVYRFVPLRAIVSVDLDTTPSGWLELTVHASPDIQIRVIFDPRRFEEVENLKKSIEAPPG